MKAWDIFNWEFPFGNHPVVVVSHPDRVDLKASVNVLKCSSHRATRQPNWSEVILDEADGLDWATLCQCDFIYAVEKNELAQRRGSVSAHRRRAIVSRIVQTFGWDKL